MCAAVWVSCCRLNAGSLPGCHQPKHIWKLLTLWVWRTKVANKQARQDRFVFFKTRRIMPETGWGWSVEHMTESVPQEHPILLSIRVSNVKMNIWRHISAIEFSFRRSYPCFISPILSSKWHLLGGVLRSVLMRHLFALYTCGSSTVALWVCGYNWLIHHVMSLPFFKIRRHHSGQWHLHSI